MRLSRSKLLVIGVLVLLVMVGVSLAFSRDIRKLYELAVVKAFPSVEVAFAYASRHFDAAHPADYDLAFAEKLYLEAQKSDDTYPYLNHQLARIHFLRGDFTVALLYIDKEIRLHGATEKNPYYVRGLIQGFIGRYDEAAKDYAVYLQSDPTNWAAVNDFAWVLLKAGRYDAALSAVDNGLASWPENPWLLNSKATALFELGRLDEASIFAARAGKQVMGVTESQWSRAYPGNDPLIATRGLQAFRDAVADNIHTISIATEKRGMDVR